MSCLQKVVITGQLGTLQLLLRNCGRFLTGSSLVSPSVQGSAGRNSSAPVLSPSFIWAHPLQVRLTVTAPRDLVSALKERRVLTTQLDLSYEDSDYSWANA